MNRRGFLALFGAAAVAPMIPVPAKPIIHPWCVIHESFIPNEMFPTRVDLLWASENLVSLPVRATERLLPMAVGDATGFFGTPA